MNRRAFLGLAGKLVELSAAIGVDPRLLRPVERMIGVTGGLTTTIILPVATPGRVFVIRKTDPKGNVVIIGSGWEKR